MVIAEDLSAEALEASLAGRPLRTYPALLSTQADAIAWARAGASEGAVVVADYQASPRGRAGLMWQVHPGEDLGFSLVLRPQLPAEREGWLYTIATSGVADALSADATIEWPDEVTTSVGGTITRAAAIGVHAELGPEGVDWAVVTCLVPGVRPPRAPTLARLVEAIEACYRSSARVVLDRYLSRCTTVGRSVRARLIPMGPSGPQVVGTAVDALSDGALVLRTAKGNRVAIRPQNLGLLDDEPS